MRPRDFAAYFGQEDITGQGRVITEMIARHAPFSMILWGEPGCGKTTLAGLIAENLAIESHFLSAVSCGVADVREVIKRGKANRESGKQTILFLDEIHRFNKAQQDSILSAVESGDIILIGATTENPSFSVIRPLLSRSRVLRLKKLSDAALGRILDNALTLDTVIAECGITLDDDARRLVIECANGDARRMLNILETAALTVRGVIDTDSIVEAVKETYGLYDKKGDRHYDTISAFIKSLRGSDPDAALLYLAMMIQSGEDPMFIARRLVIFAAEDIGNASPTALQLAVTTLHAIEKIGMPEGRIVLAQCVTFLASSPKSNASYRGIDAALAVLETKTPDIPMHLRNAPTTLMAEFGYGKNYRYPHDYPGAFVKEEYLPEGIAPEFYRPTSHGTEKMIQERLHALWPERYTSKGEQEDND